MRNPQTPAEWQNAVDAASAFLAVEDARKYGLITGGPQVDEARCEELLQQGRQRGIHPRPGCVDRLMAELK